jgi:hypothetical protein
LFANPDNWLHFQVADFHLIARCQRSGVSETVGKCAVETAFRQHSPLTANPVVPQWFKIQNHKGIP